MKDLLMIGCGNMGEAILNRISQSNLNIVCVESSKERADILRKQYSNVEFISSITEKIEVKYLFLAIKPQVFTSFAMSSSQLINCHGIISIMAGIKVEDITKYFSEIAVSRVMPNTPALLGQSASGYYINYTGQDNSDFVAFNSYVLSSIGKSIQVTSEGLLDTVTGLSGSGPAYFFSIIDAFVEVGVKNGLTAKDAQLLAAQTMKGSAEMILQGEKSLSDLKYSVMSPGGTTAAGISQLESNGMRKAVHSAVDSAIEKSRELGK